MQAAHRGLAPYDGATLTAHAFVLRFFGQDENDRLLLVNLGSDLGLCPGPEPLLAPPCNRRWRVMFSSEDVRYGGDGNALETLVDLSCHLAGFSTVLFAAEPEHE